MLMGHSYLIAPSMSVAPLMRLLAALGAAIFLRTALVCISLWWWTSHRSVSNLETDLILWLPVRWILGLLAPLALGWMAWETRAYDRCSPRPVSCMLWSSSASWES